jgi:hypothetical protein
MKIRKEIYKFCLFLINNNIRITEELIDKLNNPILYYDEPYTSRYPDNWDYKIKELYKKICRKK